MKLRIIFAGFSFAACAALAQQQPSSPPPEIAPKQETAEQKLALAELKNLALERENIRLAAQPLQDKLADLGRRYNAIQPQIDADVAEIKKQNSWGEDVTFDEATKTWRKLPKPAQPPAPDAPKPGPPAPQPPPASAVTPK